MKFTKHAIANLTLPESKSEIIHWDDDLPGFGLRLRSGGAKHWRVQYRAPGGKQRSESLGDVRKVDLESARRIARQRFAQVELGRDPGAERDATRAADAAKLNTLGRAVERYLTAKDTLRPNTRSMAERYLRVHWKALHGHQLDQIKRIQISAILSDIAEERGRHAARGARNVLSALFSWCVREGMAETNPVIGSNDPASGSQTRERVLNDDELRTVWTCTEGDDDFHKVVRLLLLTGCRREEIGSLLWTEVDLDAGKITLTASRVKNGRVHELALPDIAIDILRSQQRHGVRPYVFGKRGRGLTSWGHHKSVFDKHVTASTGRALPDFILHDLRRTAATRMADAGVLPHVIEAVLNHQSGHKGGVAGIYNRASYTAEKAQALARLSEVLMAIVEGRDSKIIPLARA